MKPIHVLYSPRAEAWQGHRVAEAFAACFTQLGFPNVTCGTRMAKFDRSDTLFLMSETATRQVSGEWLGKVCLYNISEVYSQSIGKHWFGRVKKLGRLGGWQNQRIDWIWDYAPQNEATFAKNGYPHRTFCPLAYHSSYDREPAETPPAYDVAFVGMVRRHSRRYKAVKILTQAGLKVFAEPQRNRKLSDSQVLDAQMHSRVWLHLHQGSGDRTNFPSSRIIQLGIPARIPVVIEHTNWTPLPADTYADFPTGDHNEMLKMVIWAMNNPLARVMAQRALAFLCADYQMLPFVKESAHKSGLM